MIRQGGSRERCAQRQRVHPQSGQNSGDTTRDVPPRTHWMPVTAKTASKTPYRPEGPQPAGRAPVGYPPPDPLAFQPLQEASGGRGRCFDMRRQMIIGRAGTATSSVIGNCIDQPAKRHENSLTTTAGSWPSRNRLGAGDVARHRLGANRGPWLAPDRVRCCRSDCRSTVFFTTSAGLAPDCPGRRLQPIDAAIPATPVNHATRFFLRDSRTKHLATVLGGRALGGTSQALLHPLQVRRQAGHPDPSHFGYRKQRLPPLP